MTNWGLEVAKSFHNSGQPPENFGVTVVYGEPVVICSISYDIPCFSKRLTGAKQVQHR